MTSIYTQTIWTKKRIIDAIKDFNDQYGRPPGSADWNPALAITQGRPEIAERYYQDDIWPSTTLVTRRFGSWNKAIKAAGFTPLPVGVKRVNQS